MKTVNQGSLTELDGLAAQISILPGIKLRGLMAIPAPENDYNKQVEVLEKMHQAFKQLQNQYPDIDTLSMGMTGDMEAAIACGSTLVRIGTAILALVITPINKKRLNLVWNIAISLLLVPEIWHTLLLQDWLMVVIPQKHYGKFTF